MENNILKLILESNLLNFAVIAGLTVYFLGKFIPESTKKRREELESEITKAKAAKESAEAKLKELEVEIEKSKSESVKIVENAKQTAESIKDKILSEAKQEIVRLNHSAEREIEQQRILAIDSIKKEIAHLTVQELEKTLTAKKDQINQQIQNKIKKDLQKI